MKRNMIAQRAGEDENPVEIQFRKWTAEGEENLGKRRMHRHGMRSVSICLRKAYVSSRRYVGISQRAWRKP